MERKEAVLIACVPVSLARYVTCVGESMKQANVSSLIAVEACVHWQEADSCFTASAVMSAIFSSVRSVWKRKEREKIGRRMRRTRSWTKLDEEDI